MKKGFALLLVLVLCAAIGGAALGEAELSYDGEVVAGESIPVTAPYGGLISVMIPRGNSWVKAGDEICEIEGKLNYAPIEGTVTGLYAVEGDGAESIGERYGAVLFIEPTHKYVIQGSSEKAYNKSENYFVHLGERVYMSCIKDGTHQGTGVVSALTESGYTVEVTGGEFYLNEKVDIYRTSEKTKDSCIGRGTVNRAKPVEVKGTGSILKLLVKNGDFVERGEALFETVEGVLDGLYAPDRKVLSPVTGVVESVEKHKGENAAKGDALIKVSPADSFQVEFSVPESDLFSLTEGQPVKLELYWDNEDGGTYDGKIAAISYKNETAAASATTTTSDRKSYKVWASFTPDERIRLGMTMVVYPVTAPEEEPENTTEEE